MPRTFYWQWLGFSTKGNAKVSLLNCGFIENEDLMINHKSTATGIKPYPSESISLTTECFKTWCMMAKTEKGKEVRRWGKVLNLTNFPKKKGKETMSLIGLIL